MNTPTPVPSPPKKTFAQKVVAFYNAHKKACLITFAVILIVVVARSV